LKYRSLDHLEIINSFSSGFFTPLRSVQNDTFETAPARLEAFLPPLSFGKGLGVRFPSLNEIFKTEFWLKMLRLKVE
jgi:hypothetical protein